MQQRAAALDPRQVEELVDHLDEVARLDLDLADPVAHPRRDRLAGGVGLAGERLGEQADGRERGAQLVRQVVDELGPDALEPAQLGDVLQDQPAATGGARRARTRSVGPSASARVSSPDAAPVSLAVRATPRSGVDERLDRAPADRASCRARDAGTGGRRAFADVDLELIGQVDDAHPDEFDEQVEVAGVLLGAGLERGDPVLEGADPALDVEAGGVTRETTETAEFEPPADGDSDREDGQDGESDIERGHGTSIAQRGRAARSVAG